MGALNKLNPTLLDVARRTDPNGKIADVVEILNETNGILDDMTWLECNNGTNHVTTVRTGIPRGQWRKLYKGVPDDKSTTKQVQDTCGLYEARSKIDAKLLALNGNSNDWRLSEERPFFEGINEDLAEALFYGDTDVQPELFMGLSPRFNAYQNTDKDLSSYNVIDGAGRTVSGQTSVWFVVWGPNTMHGLYPNGSKAGLDMKNLGEIEVPDEAGNQYTAAVTKWQWDAGLSVRNWKSIVRVANLDVAALIANSAAPDVFDLFTQAIHRQMYRKLGRAVIYCNRTILTALDRQAQKKDNLFLTYKEVGGQEILHFRGIPIRECMAILDTEDVVPAAE